jgi:D-arabinose 1-dehydrogenase-like Zn-dependent alcohol dehydrogenase
MKAQVLKSFDGPRGFELCEVEEPHITAPDQVKIRVEACGVCHRDITWSRGRFSGAELPRILGHEGAGVVTEVGGAVETLRPGDRVVHLQAVYCGQCEACRGGRPAVCSKLRELVGEARDGCYAQHVVLPERIVLKIPGEIPMESAAVAACTLGTAYHALRLHGFDARGKTVALNGAGGGVGLHAIQVAKALGARVIAVTTSAGKAGDIRSAGADEVVVAPDGIYRKEIAEITRGSLPDMFLEIAGAPTLEQSLLSVRRGGRVVVIGNPDGGTCQFNPALLILRGELMLYGSLGITMPELIELLALVANGKLRPRIDQAAPLAELPRLMKRMEERSTIGRVVVLPN